MSSSLRGRFTKPENIVSDSDICSSNKSNAPQSVKLSFSTRVAAVLEQTNLLGLRNSDIPRRQKYTTDFLVRRTLHLHFFQQHCVYMVCKLDGRTRNKLDPPIGEDIPSPPSKRRFYVTYSHIQIHFYNVKLWLLSVDIVVVVKHYMEMCDFWHIVELWSQLSLTNSIMHLLKQEWRDCGVFLSSLISSVKWSEVDHFWGNLFYKIWQVRNPGSNRSMGQTLSSRYRTAVLYKIMSELLNSFLKSYSTASIVF